MCRFIEVAVLVLVLLVTVGCRAPALVQGMPTSNEAVQVDKMFDFQGTTVYRFANGGGDHSRFAYFAACTEAEQPERSERRSGSYLLTSYAQPVSLRILNNSNQFIQVYDGAFLLSSLVPGEERMANLQLSGRRSLKIRSASWTVETPVQYFETNCGWSLTVNMSNTISLDLLPIDCR